MCIYKYEYNTIAFTIAINRPNRAKKHILDDPAIFRGSINRERYLCCLPYCSEAQEKSHTTKSLAKRLNALNVYEPSIVNLVCLYILAKLRSRLTILLKTLVSNLQF